MLEDRAGKDRVKGGRGKGQRTEIAHLETHVRHLVFLGKRPGPLDHAGLAIHPNNLARGNGLSQAKGDRSGAAATVQEGHARMQVGQEKGGLVGGLTPEVMLLDYWGAIATHGARVPFGVPFGLG
jgi:hypothetical protein